MPKGTVRLLPLGKVTRISPEAVMSKAKDMHSKFKSSLELLGFEDTHKHKLLNCTSLGDPPKRRVRLHPCQAIHSSGPSVLFFVHVQGLGFQCTWRPPQSRGNKSSVAMKNCKKHHPRPKRVNKDLPRLLPLQPVFHSSTCSSCEGVDHCSPPAKPKNWLSKFIQPSQQ